MYFAKDINITWPEDHLVFLKG